MLFYVKKHAAKHVYKAQLQRLIRSVTRLGDLLDFGQLFKAFGNKSPTFLGKFCKVVKIFNFSIYGSFN